MASRGSALARPRTRLLLLASELRACMCALRGWSVWDLGFRVGVWGGADWEGGRGEGATDEDRDESHSIASISLSVCHAPSVPLTREPGLDMGLVRKEAPLRVCAVAAAVRALRCVRILSLASPPVGALGLCV